MELTLPAASLGAANAIINFRLAGDEVDDAANDAGAKVLLVGSELMPLVEKTSSRKVVRPDSGEEVATGAHGELWFRTPGRTGRGATEQRSERAPPAAPHQSRQGSSEGYGQWFAGRGHLPVWSHEPREHRPA